MFFGAKNFNAKIKRTFFRAGDACQKPSFSLGKNKIFKKLHFWASTIFDEKVSNNTQEFSPELTMRLFSEKSRQNCVQGTA